MMKRRSPLLLLKCQVVTIFLIIYTGPAIAQLPLVSDNTGTLGKGKFQIEALGTFSRDKSDNVMEKAFSLDQILTFGVINTLDVVVGESYQYLRNSPGGQVIKGFTDLSLELKWRVYESPKFGIAIKPGVSFPTGDHTLGLGSGKVGYTCFAVSTISLTKTFVNLNLGYIRNENKFGDEPNLWHASVSFDNEFLPRLHAVCNAGVETNSALREGLHKHNWFTVAGIYYAFCDCFEVCGAYKGGLSEPEVDNAFLTGLTLRF